MLPFVFLDETKLGPFHPYGIACALGFFAWDWAIMKRAQQAGYDRTDFRVLTVVLGVFGWFFAWWIDAVFYAPKGTIGQSLTALAGFSATGAMVGATIGGVLWCRYSFLKSKDGKWKLAKREKPHAKLPLAEVILSTWPIAFAFGRLGCSLIHDHPGATVPKDSFAATFALAWPRGPEDGVHHVFGPLHVVTGGSDARFDLGFIELVILAVMAIAFMFLWRKKLVLGTYTMVASLVYGAFRFGLDFLRAPDGEPGGEPRHGGLTFAQYWSLAILALGIVLLVRRIKHAAPEQEPATH